MWNNKTTAEPHSSLRTGFPPACCSWQRTRGICLASLQGFSVTRIAHPFQVSYDAVSHVLVSIRAGRVRPLHGNLAGASPATTPAQATMQQVQRSGTPCGRSGLPFTQNDEPLPQVTSTILICSMDEGRWSEPKGSCMRTAATPACALR